MSRTKLFVPCFLCPDKFSSELNMRAHAMKVHSRYIPECTTGLAERLIRQATMKIRRRKEFMTSYDVRSKSVKTRSFNRYGNSNYGKARQFFDYVARGFKAYRRSDIP